MDGKSDQLQDNPFFFMGRNVGTYDSVDIYPETGMKVYNFKPAPACKIPAGDIFLDLGKGSATPIIKGEKPGTGLDLIDAIKDCARPTEDEMKKVEEQLDDLDDGTTDDGEDE